MKKILLSLIVIVGFATTSSYAWTYYDINDYHAIINAQPGYYQYPVECEQCLNQYAVTLDVTVYLPYLNYSGIYLAMVTGYPEGWASFSGMGYWNSVSCGNSDYNTIPSYAAGNTINLSVGNSGNIFVSYY